MREIETDYLVVGAGASGLAFVDALIAKSDADVVMVDRRHRPGGHWLDAYPFVRLHQPSPNYGVDSRILGNNLIDKTGPNAGYYERASAVEICEYFNRVLEEVLVASGQVRFLGMHDYRGAGTDGHLVVSSLSGEEITVKVRRKLVDATYVESSIPSRHTPSYEVDEGVRLIPPNDLVHMAEPASGYTVIGAGKTSMDTCNWLLDEGVPPDRIRWIKPRDGWFINRDYMQPLDLVGSYMELQAAWLEAASQAESGHDMARRLGDRDILVRIDPSVEADVFRGAILSKRERDSLQRIENVVRTGRILRIGTDRVMLEGGSIPSDPGQAYIDCTAQGVRPVATRPIFERNLITLQYVTLGIVPWGAATIGTVEAMRDDDAEKNRLCPPLMFTGNTADFLSLAYPGITGLTARMSDPDIAQWNEATHLNPGRGAADHMDDPRVPASLESMMTNIGPALTNLAQRVGA